MYIQHFGLAQYPFSLAPDTHYFLKLPSQQAAFNLVISALQDDSNFSKIVGEAGAGKTMLCRKLLNALEVHKDRYITAYIPHPIMSEEAMMHALAEELSIEHETNISYYELLKVVTKELLSLFRDDKTVVLFVDEAQAIPQETLEAIRLLTSIDDTHGNRLRIILFGQPELDELLEQPDLTELKHALSFSFKLSLLDRQEVETYVEHRLFKAGYNGSQMFAENALDLLFKGSRGVPRLINILAHKALMVAFEKGDQIVTEKHVFDAILDIESAPQKQSLHQRLFTD
jgi:MSHA biogenesis protein MshM